MPDENTTANASGTRREMREIQKKLKEVEASVSYSAVLADTIHRVANIVSGQKKGGK